MARILIVDDDAAFRGSLAETVGDLGHEVLEAGSTAAGLTLLAAHAVDAAIVDLRMPGGSGLELLEALRAADPTLRVVVLTGYGSIATAVEAMRLGAVNVLAKPADADMVCSPWVAAENFNPGYLTRGLHLLPRQGDRQPWLHTQDYWRDKDELPAAPFDDGSLRFA